MAEEANAERDHVDRFLESVSAELPPLDLRVEGIVDRIQGLSRRLRRMLDETLAEHGLSHADWQVLNTLRWAGPPYRRSAGQLAERSDLSSGAMTARLDKLEESGLVRRLPDPSDRRAIQVELTEAGRRAHHDSISTQAAKEALVGEALDEREKEELNNLLRRVMLAFERREADEKKSRRA